jgi:hypothetical protein
LQDLTLILHAIDRKLMGEVEVDETCIGGNARNMHQDKRLKTLRAEGRFRKAVVVGMLERKGEVRMEMINGASSKLLAEVVKKYVVPGSMARLYEGRKRIRAQNHHHAETMCVETCIPTALKASGAC